MKKRHIDRKRLILFITLSVFILIIGLTFIKYYNLNLIKDNFFGKDWEKVIESMEGRVKEVIGEEMHVGLMFKLKNTNPLLFRFNEPVMIPIHSRFVFFPFVISWTLEDGTFENKIVVPFQNNILPSKKFTEFYEFPIISFSRNKIVVRDNFLMESRINN